MNGRTVYKFELGADVEFRHDSGSELMVWADGGHREMARLPYDEIVRLRDALTDFIDGLTAATCIAVYDLNAGTAEIHPVHCRCHHNFREHRTEPGPPDSYDGMATTSAHECCSCPCAQFAPLRGPDTCVKNRPA